MDRSFPRSRLYLWLAVGTQALSLLDFIYTTVGLRLIPGSFEINPFFGGRDKGTVLLSQLCHSLT